MQETQVEFVEESIDITSRGVITGIVFFDFGGFQFPEREWNDAVIVILGWWLAALVDLVKGITEGIELRFMDGQFRLSVQRESGDECLVRCIDGQKARDEFESHSSALALLRSTLRAAIRAQRICHQRGWHSADIEALYGFVSSARKLTREH